MILILKNADDVDILSITLFTKSTLLLSLSRATIRIFTDSKSLSRLSPETLALGPSACL